MHYYFTWREFGLTMAAALLIYYLIVAVCCYRQELGEFFKGKVIPPYAETGYDAIGAVKEDEAEMSLVNIKDLDFAGSEEMTATRDKNKVLLLGGLADFMHELKTLVRITIEGVNPSISWGFFRCQKRYRKPATYIPDLPRNQTLG